MKAELPLLTERGGTIAEVLRSITERDDEDCETAWQIFEQCPWDEGDELTDVINSFAALGWTTTRIWSKCEEFGVSDQRHPLTLLEVTILAVEHRVRFHAETFSVQMTTENQSSPLPKLLLYQGAICPKCGFGTV